MEDNNKEMKGLYCYNCYKKTNEKIPMPYEGEEEITCLTEPSIKWYVSVYRCPLCSATEEFPHREGEESSEVSSLFSIDFMEEYDEGEVIE